MRMRCLLLLMCVLGLAIGASAAAPNTTATVESFSPLGTARQVRQVSVRFSAAMVALGDPRLPDPFSIQCDAKGTGHWADARNWVFDFDEDLPAGLRCRFTLKEGLRAANGSPVAPAQPFEFSTGGPRIAASFPRDGWNQIDEEQVFLVKLDAPADVASVQASARCIVQGIGEEIPVEVLVGDARQAVLQQSKSLGYEYFQLLWKSGNTSNIRVRDRTLESAQANIIVLRCQRRLPPASQVNLLWGAGIRTQSGVSTTADQKLAFRVRPAFVARAECTRANARAGCMPMLPISLRFNAPVPRAAALAVRLKIAGGKLLSPVASSADSAETMESVEFAPPFPENRPVSIVLPAELHDDAGRTLENAARFPLEVRVEGFPPLAKFSGNFGILEASEGGILPVTLRNVEPKLQAQESVLPARSLRLDSDPAVIASWLRRIETAAEQRGEFEQIPESERQAAPTAQPRLGTDEEDEGDVDPTRRWREDTGSKSVFEHADATTKFSVAKPAGGKAFEVVGIPLKKPGFYVVEIQSGVLGRSLLGRDQPRYVATAALVTDLAVHFKWGRESSVVWVTQLHDGQPVPGATVSIADYCDGTVRWTGTTGANGLATVDKTLGSPHGSSWCGNYVREKPLMVLARKGDDVSFALSFWDQGISPGDFSLPRGNEYQSLVVHTVFDRALFRAGETVSMKHVLRRHAMSGFEVPAAAAGARAMSIRHQGSGQEYKLQAVFGSDGIAENTWTIPVEAKLGQYDVFVNDGNEPRISGQFRVEQFRLPSMRSSVIGSAVPLVNPKTADIDLHVSYLSGGGAAGRAVKLRTQVLPSNLSFAGYDDYRFGGSAVTEGIVLNENGPQDFDFEPDKPQESTRVQVLPLTLDASGAARVTIPDLPALDGAAQLTAELEYADDNGELLTGSGHVRLVPSSLALGIRTESWAGSAQQVRFRVVALDINGRPQAQRAIHVALYQSKRYSYRKRLIGGFYAYETTRETHKLKAACEGNTDAQGLLACEVAPGVSGEITIRAEAADAEGRISGATTSTWVFDQADSWFGGTSGDRMDVLPERKSYESGETARFQVRMPFREATALVTVERQGVMSSFVTHLDSSRPVIELPVDRTYAPNVFVSVLAVRGRVAHADNASTRKSRQQATTAQVDLNKPAYRLGVASIKVGWKPHRLEVRVTPEHKTYKVRERASVRVHVARADGGDLPAGTEVAIAAVDSALLDLAPNRSWDLLAAMMGERGLEVLTSTAQMQVVGKRHYGRKAVASGGGGGRDQARELFDSLLYWKARVQLDAGGDAVVSVPLNDSLTEFRIVAIANGATGLFGTGSTLVNTTQDLILVSGLPPVVREGDEFLATFTLRNTSDRHISAQIGGSKTADKLQALQQQLVELDAGQARDISWRVSAPVNSAALRWDVSVQERGGTASDRMRLIEKVIAAYPVRTYQATITQLNEPYAVPVSRPAGAIAGRGGLEVMLRAHLGDGMDGVREYARLYPYSCIEQLLSTAVIQRDLGQWNAAMKRLPAFLDGDGLLRYFATDSLPGEDSLTAYVLAIADEAGWAIEESIRNRMSTALRNFVQGRIKRGSALPTADLTIRKLAAIEALSRYRLADKSMLDSLTVEPDLWPTSAVIDWLGILQRVAGADPDGRRVQAALAILRGRLNFQGTIMGFSTERTDALWWLMISSDSNANRMLLTVLARPEWREDVPRLVRGALARQQRGHWNTTVANAWGVLAMEKFSARFESAPVSGASAVSYGTTVQPVAWKADVNSAEVNLPWQEGTGQLTVSHTGTGKPWVMLRTTAALPSTIPLSSGYTIRRLITPVEQKTAGRWSRGDVLRIRLELQAQTDMSWVVVDDPVPAGASILGGGLANQSSLLTQGERREGWAWQGFDERRFDGMRVYYRFVPKGSWIVEYTVRLNNPGTFSLPATRVEAMYAPEMFGELPNAPMTVVP